MKLETLFSLGYAVICPAWLLLIVAPRWKWTQRLINSCAIPLLISSAYFYLIAAYFPKTRGGFGSLADVARVFQTPQILLAGWFHYLAFDLFIAGWEVRDAQKLGISHIWVIPCLIATCLLGPIGFLSYFILRWSLTKRIFLED